MSIFTAKKGSEAKSGSIARGTAVEEETTRAASEWRFVAAAIVVVMLVTLLPYVYAYSSTPPDKHFMGIMLDVPDHAQYFSWMRDLSTSNLVSNKLTPEPNRAIFFNLLWWALGRLSILLGIGYAAVFQILRLVGGVLFLVVVYHMCTFFLQDVRMRRIAFLTVLFTSGFGWVLIVLKYTLAHGQLYLPLDVFIAEGNTFLGILGYPHFIAAGLYIFVFFLVMRGEALYQRRYAVAAGLLALFLGWQHAYDLVLVYGILAGYVLLRWRRDRHLPFFLIQSLFLLGILSFWPALYSVVLTRADPVWKTVLAQFANAGVFTPPPWQLFILLGPAFVMALYTVVRRQPLKLRRWNDKDLFLLAWLGSNLLLIYIPTDFQIHMLNGIQVPIALLAAQGLFLYILPTLQRWLKRFPSAQITAWQNRLPALMAAVVLVVILPTNLYLWSWRFFELSQHQYPYYLYNDELKAMSWLNSTGTEDQVVLSSLTIGQYVPVMTGKHAFLAHWAQTLNFYGKQSMVEEFYNASTSDSRREEILRQFRVNYVFYGPAERQIGEYSPEGSSFLKPVFSTSLVKVFEVEQP